MKIYNYLSQKIEEFKPIGKIVGLYSCGPTVYDFVHIGNWRTFVFEDILRRVLEFNGFRVKQVMNITDIDDKIIRRAHKERKSAEEIAKKFEKAFFEDLGKLNIVFADIYPRATENITEMIRIIKLLIEKGYAYSSRDGVYFSVEKFRKYGKLSGLEKKNLKRGVRIDADQYSKEAWADFALWKFERKGEPSWPAPFGKGRPGWHIECSAMSMKYLGGSFDIHTGGVDLLFPHHENEIAQSESVSGRKFVNFWCEGEHLLVEGKKMAKSLGNIFTLDDIKSKGFDPLALRYLFLTAHYRAKLNFTWKSLEAAQRALFNLRLEVSNWEEPRIGCAQFEGDFREAVNFDLDMPRAIAVMWDMVKSNYPTSAKHKSILVMDKVLGLGLDKIKMAKLPEDAQELIEKREELRKIGKFKQADKLREKLASMGILVEDTAEGPKWKIVRLTEIEQGND